jgi:hypothetical protein
MTAQGVHLTDSGYGNIKSGSGDFVLGALDQWPSRGKNYHSSGIVAKFSHGVTKVSFQCTDDDGTLKRLYAFDQNGKQIGRTPASSQTLFTIDVTQTNGGLIYSTEFDTLPGSKGGASDGTYFTLDNFRVEGIISEETRGKDLALETLSRLLNPPKRKLLNLNLASGSDALNQSKGNLLFSGSEGFEMVVTDDGVFSGDMAGVRFVRAPSGNRIEPSNNKGLVVLFNYGLMEVTLRGYASVSGQKLFAYDLSGRLVAEKSPDGNLSFALRRQDTDGQLIYGLELDTKAGNQTGAVLGTPFSFEDLQGWGSMGVKNIQRDVMFGVLSKTITNTAILTSRASQSRQLIKLDFDCGTDTIGQTSGDLYFQGVDGFQLILTDDDSDGSYGGQADGVHLTNKKYGNDKAYTADLVVGANNNWAIRGTTNYHSSGIVAKFSHGVEAVSLLCTDDDSTTKTLFAFDENGKQIGKSAAGSRRPFSINTTMTQSGLIYAIEFDTVAGQKGGSTDGTYFTLDNIEVQGRATDATARRSLVNGFLNTAQSQARELIYLSFNSKTDSFVRQQGDLVFKGERNFRVLFTDDDSSGSRGGNADGVHITNQNYGNNKVGSTTDFVLGAYNSRPSSSTNYHSSGIVARFSHGVTKVGFLCTDDDATKKTLFAFDEKGNQIGKTAAGSQIPFSIDTTSTGGKLIYSVEFDTSAGTAGGSNDGTVFTIDNFYAAGPVPCAGTQLQRTSVSLKSDFILIDHRRLIFLDFNSGVDHMGRAQGDLIFIGNDGFQILFTDDGSKGTYGGDADGVHISNQDHGNDKDGTDDLVLGAYNSYSGSNNYHSSGIVARFSHGVQRVSLECTDDDTTTKSLFAFDEDGKQIGKTAASSRVPFIIDTTMTSGKLIFAVEFDTQAGSNGGSYDGTYFTVDNFKVEGVVKSDTVRNHF